MTAPSRRQASSVADGPNQTNDSAAMASDRQSGIDNNNNSTHSHNTDETDAGAGVGYLCSSVVVLLALAITGLPLLSRITSEAGTLSPGNRTSVPASLFPEIRPLAQFRSGYYEDEVAPPHGSVDTRFSHEVFPAGFFMHYVLRSKPLHVIGGAKAWPALTKWTNSYLLQKLGSEEVIVDVSRDNYFPLGSAQEVSEMSFGSFINHFDQATGKRQLYLTGAANIKPVFGDLRPLPFAERLDFLFAALWMGAGIQRSSLAFDAMETCMCMVRGTLTVTLYSPDQSKFLYPLFTNNQFFSPVNIAHPDYTKFPEFLHATPTAKVTLVAGDVLFVPAFWWHYTEAGDGENIMISHSFKVHSTLLFAMYHALQESLPANETAYGL